MTGSAKVKATLVEPHKRVKGSLCCACILRLVYVLRLHGLNWVVLSREIRQHLLRLFNSFLGGPTHYVLILRCHQPFQVNRSSLLPGRLGSLYGLTAVCHSTMKPRMYEADTACGFFTGFWPGDLREDPSFLTQHTQVFLPRTHSPPRSRPSLCNTKNIEDRPSSSVGRE